MNRSLILAPHEVRAALRGPVLIVRAYRLPNRETTQPASVHPDGSGLGWVAWWPKPVTAEETARIYPGNAGFPCPLGSPGERRAVKETWGYRCSVWTMGEPLQQHHIRYRADDAERAIDRPQGDRSGLPRQRPEHAGESDSSYQDYLRAYWAAWRSPVTLPAWASRLTVEVASVECRRVASISEEEAKAAGHDRVPEVLVDRFARAAERRGMDGPHVFVFQGWWESRPGCSWADWAWFVRVVAV